ncbi:hypothetical protein [Pectobacterium brasiliense]|uniref:hypothetical protein n=1 Tax=Pectobacterium brasiliense TaxID=180957 RepID=UPI001F07232C|nr:hypothetical protein [Pectobacterium brasiliense]
MNDMTDCNEKNTPFFDRVRKNTPRWAHDIIQRWDDITFRLASDFITHHYWTSQGSINVFRIVGTDHPQYAGMTWLDFLDRGKRMDINIPLIEKNPIYYTDPECLHAGMNFISLDGIHWYVGSDGNHRSCLARFHYHLEDVGRTQLHHVSLSLFRIDWVFFHAWRKLHAFLPVLLAQGYQGQLEVNRTTIEREDSPGWKMDRFQAVATLTLDVGKEHPEIKTFVLNDGQEVLDCLSFLKQQSSLSSPTWGKDDRTPEHEKLPWWRRFTGRKGQ